MENKELNKIVNELQRLNHSFDKLIKELVESKEQLKRDELKEKTYPVFLQLYKMLNEESCLFSSEFIKVNFGLSEQEFEVLIEMLTESGYFKK